MPGRTRAGFAVAAIAIATASGSGGPESAAGASSGDFSLQSSSVAPREAFFDAVGGVRIDFRFAAAAPADVSVRVVGAAGEARAYALAQLPPGEHRVVWDGLTSAGKAAPDGGYRVLVGAVGAEPTEAGRLTLRGHRYPVRAPHSFRGAVGEFGAARNGGRIHQGFDINAACGKPVLAARGGSVIRRRYDGRLDGNFIVIRGFRENRTYRYSHLSAPAPVRLGERVRTGQLVGRVGRSGNARSVGCHLHFEIRRGGRFIDPEPELRRWDRFS